jgi:hypothetical protein
MRNGVLLLSLFAAAMCPGCGGVTTPSSILPSSPLHGGILIPLPENQGFVELLNDKRERRGRVFLTTVVAYLLQPDQKTALAHKPTQVSVKLDTASGRKTLLLVAEPNPGDSLGEVRFTSELGPFELDQRGGEITLAINGKTLTSPFRGPR